MTTYARGGFSFGVNLETLLDRAAFEARLGSSGNRYGQLGATTTQQNTRVAEIVNDVIRELTVKNPIFGVSGTPDQITLSTSTNTYAIPTTMQGVGIRRVQFDTNQANAWYSDREIPFWDVMQVDQLNPIYKSDQWTTYSYPEGCSFDETGENIVFYPWPALDGVIVNVYFRAKATSVTAANIASPSSVTVGEIPTDFAQVYAQFIAYRMVEGWKFDRAAELKLDLFGVRGNPDQPGSLLEMQREIAQTMAFQKSGNRDNAMQNQVLNENQLFRMGLWSNNRSARRI